MNSKSFFTQKTWKVKIIIHDLNHESIFYCTHTINLDSQFLEYLGYITFFENKKNPVCSGVNLNCPRGAVACKKAFMFYLIVKGTKSISRIKIHGPFLFWLENSSIISWLCGSFLSISLSRGANKGKRPQRSPSYFFNTFFNVQDFLINLGIHWK